MERLAAMRCPGCHSARTVRGPARYCAHCGRVLLTREQVRELCDGAPPAGAQIVTRGEPSDRMSPYRSGVSDDPTLEVDFIHEKRRGIPSAIVLVLALSMVAPGRRGGTEMRIFLAIVGFAALVFCLVPRRTKMTMAISRKSIAFGQRGVPRSRWRSVDARGFGQVIAVAEPAPSGRGVRYGIDVHFQTGATRTLLRSLKDAELATWLALTIERALGFEGTSMRALDPRGT